MENKIDKSLFEALKHAEKGLTLSDSELQLLEQGNYIDSNKSINKLGLDTLEPFRVKRAIIMAAGFGSRMVPVTLDMPKPLVKVNGTRFIETNIDRLVQIGIKDIIIIRGYLKDKFDVLLSKYPFLKFIDNDKFNKENNISSAILVADKLQNTYLCESDFFITGDDVIEKYQYESNYLGSPVEKTDDWCFDKDDNGYAYNYRKGGSNCYQAFGISYWDSNDGRLLEKKLKEMYSNPKNRDLFWEMAIFELYKETIKVKIRNVRLSSLVEIDSFEELCSIDESYKNYGR